MKIRFTEAPKGRHYKVGEIVEFKGPVPESYARKYIARGWAVEHVEEVAEKPKLVEPVAERQTLSVKPKIIPPAKND